MTGPRTPVPHLQTGATAGDTGSPRPWALVQEGWHSARAQPVATVTIALVVALVCGVVLMTTGRTAAVEHDVVASIEDVGARVVAVTDSTGQAGIDPGAVTAITGLAGVTWAFGLGPATDVVAVHDTGRLLGVPMRDYVGSLPDDVALVRGRLPTRDGEAVTGSSATTVVGLVDGMGPVDASGRHVGVVGEVRASGPLSTLDDMVLRRAAADAAPDLRYVYVLAESATTASELAEVIAAVLPADDPEAVDVATSEGVLQLRDVVAGRIGAGSRQLMAGVLAVGLVLVSVTVHGAVSARRRDIGRRRALGASRSAIVALVLVQTAVAAVAGAALGTTVGLVVVRVTSEHLPSPSFTAGLTALAGLVALLGSVGPAAAAAARDPLRVLRVP